MEGGFAYICPREVTPYWIGEFAEGTRHCVHSQSDQTKENTRHMHLSVNRNRHEKKKMSRIGE
jgi:hypothetical protein